MRNSADHFLRKDCRLCNGQDLSLVFKLAPTPPANGFLSKSQLNDGQEKKYPLDLYFCRSCYHLQLCDVVNPEILFRNYVYVSGTSPVFVSHFQKYARNIIDRYQLKPGDFAFEIGSNDGTLLRFFKEAGLKVLGVDPAKNIAEQASAEGIPTLPLFFHEGLGREISDKHGKSKVILANNVFAHIDDLSSVTKGIANLLDDNGIFVFEVSYLVDVFEKVLFDTIYHEHLAYHSIKPLVKFFERHGLELIDAERVDSHGGSLRGTVQKKGGPFRLHPRVNELMDKEEHLGLYKEGTFKKFAERIDSLGKTLNQKLRSLKSEGKRISAFGAPAKATTLMHHFQIDKSFVDFIVDDSPLKQGLFSPGYHIPVVGSEAIYREKPDYLVILAWNFADSIIAKHQRFINEGGHFLVPLPEFREV